MPSLRCGRVGALAALAASPGFDESLFRALNLAGTNPALDAVMVALSLASTAYVLALLAIPIWWRGRREAAFDLVFLLGLAVVVTEAIKFAVGRPRPCGTLPDVRTLAGFGCDAEFDPAFPSGHASRAFAAAALLGLRFRGRGGGAALAFAALAGLSRIYLGVHWPTDVLGGAALGVGLALALETASRQIGFYRRLRARILAAIPHLGPRPRP